MKPPRRLLRELNDPIHLTGVTYQQKWIQCSKPTCDTWHGPYWYAYWKLPVVDKGRKRTGGKTISKYIGRELPTSIIDAFRELSNDEQEVGREANRELRRRRKKR